MSGLRGPFAIAILIALFPSATSAKSACYRSCDSNFSSCYSQCKGEASCKSRCEQPRYLCLDDCLVGPSAGEAEVIAITNRVRVSYGLGTLVWNPRLSRASRNHAVNMARQERMEHAMDGLDGGDRLRYAGYEGRTWAENVARGWGKGGTPKAVVKWWLNSPGHRANLLAPHLKEIGVGVYTGNDGATYYCQSFGSQTERLLSSYVR